MNLRLIKAAFVLSSIFSSKQIFSMEAAAKWFTTTYPTAIIICPKTGVTLDNRRYPGVTGLFKALKTLKEIIKSLDVGEPELQEELYSESDFSTINLTPSSSRASTATSCQCSQNIFEQCAHCAP